MKITYISYFPYNAALVVASGNAIAELATASNIQRTTLYQPSFRAQPSLLRVPEAGQYIVQFANVPQAAKPAADLAARSQTAGRVYPVGRFLNVAGTFSSATVLQSAREPYVIGIAPVQEAMLSGEREAISLTHTSQLSYGDPYQDGTRPYKPIYDYRTWLSNRGVLDTSGYRIAFVDTGLDDAPNQTRPPHPDLDRTGTVRQDYTLFGNPGDGYGHGTLVAGLALGDPAVAPPSNMTTQFDSGGFYLGMGVAPKTRIYSQKIFTNFGHRTTDYWSYPLTLANDAYYWGSAVQNHSYQETGTAGTYTVYSQEIDLAVRDTYGDAPVTSMPMTIAAGNICQGEVSGCTTEVTSPGTAKNAITVGGVESWRPSTFFSCASGTSRPAQDFYADSFQNVAWTSRRGTHDGRYKPEILAPMTQISSTRTQHQVGSATPDGGFFCNNTSDFFYSYDTGTSFAAPQAAGAVVLLNKKHNARFSPAMLKAALVGNSTSVRYGIDRRSGGSVGSRPNVAQGFGRLSLGKALGNVNTQTLLDESSWTPFTGSGQLRTRTFTVANQAEPTIIVLAWTDEPANFDTPPAVNTAPKLVRDLDMSILTSSCSGYTGNRMDSTEFSIHQSSWCGNFTYDYRNNVEMIVLPPNSMSSFTV